jgi:hypothetical protein
MAKIDKLALIHWVHWPTIFVSLFAMSVTCLARTLMKDCVIAESWDGKWLMG